MTPRQNGLPWMLRRSDFPKVYLASLVLICGVESTQKTDANVQEHADRLYKWIKLRKGATTANDYYYDTDFWAPHFQITCRMDVMRKGYGYLYNHSSGSFRG